MNTTLRAVAPSPCPNDFDSIAFASSRTSTYTVECADPHRHDRAVRLLIERMYSWRGLAPVDADVGTARPDRITLVASDESAIFGTVTLGLDGRDGILADALGTTPTTHDTGSAIVGAARADVFIGSGPRAGDIAGLIRHSSRFFVFMPLESRSNGAP